MNAESESSPPMEVAYTVRSTSPAATQYSLSLTDDLASKSDTSSPQEMQQTRDMQQTPKRSKHKRVKSDTTERPASAQSDRRNDLEDHSDVDAGRDLSDDEDGDPALQIHDFDWDKLLQEYHDAIKQCNQEEQGLSEEWRKLMEYFQIWANSGHERETLRTFQRLKTRTMYVQSEEDELERKRQHYVNVVKAFESALALLKNNAVFCG